MGRRERLGGGRQTIHQPSRSPRFTRYRVSGISSDTLARRVRPRQVFNAPQFQIAAVLFGCACGEPSEVRGVIPIGKGKDLFQVQKTLLTFFFFGTLLLYAREYHAIMHAKDSWKFWLIPKGKAKMAYRSRDELTDILVSSTFWARMFAVAVGDTLKRRKRDPYPIRSSCLPPELPRETRPRGTRLRAVTYVGDTAR